MSSQSLDRPNHGGNLAWAAQLSGIPPDSILDFSASINPLGPPASVLDAIQGHLTQIKTYPDPDAYGLRMALSQFHQAPPAFILPGNGSAELLTWACRELSECGTTAMITPAFGDYGRALQAFDAAIAPYPMSLSSPTEGDRSASPIAHSPFEAALKRLLDAPASSGILLNNPHNPTGYLATSEALQPILERFALVVMDEAFMDFLPGEPQSLIPWIERYPNLVVLRSLTKFYSVPGLRIGYAIAHPDRLHRWQQWRDPWSVNTLATVAAIAAVQDHAFQQRTWNWLTSARSQLFQGIQSIPGFHPLPGTVNYLLVHHQGSVPDLQYSLLTQAQILIRDCLSFPELGDRFFRVAVRTEAENQRLLSALAGFGIDGGTCNG